MNCQDLARTIDDYLDGELDEVATFRVRGHLQTCADCRERFAPLLSTIAELEDMPELRAPEELVPSVLARLRQPAGEHVPAHRVGWVLGLMGAVSSALMLILLPGVVWIAWTALGAVGASVTAALGAVPHVGFLLAQAATTMADAVDEMLRIALVLDVVLLVAVLMSIWAWVNRSRLTPRANVLMA